MINRRSMLFGGGATIALVAMGGELNVADAAVAGNLRPGSRGNSVKALQNRLNQLGYWCGGADGVYGLATSQAVMALQKSCGLARDGICGSRTAAKVNAGQKPGPRTKGSGKYIEIDKNRQILMLVNNGRVDKIFNTSTGDNLRHYDRAFGSFVGRTPSGSFRIGYRYLSGWKKGPLGEMYKPTFFNGNIAIHGSNSVPARNVSHGCCRVTPQAQNWMLSTGWLNGGMRVIVY